MQFKLPLPPTKLRVTIIRLLDAFYEEYQKEKFDLAVQLLAKWYRLPIPPIHWWEYLDGGRTGGVTYDNGEIHMQHPENWKASKSRTQGKQKWIRMVLHEWGHYYLHSNAESKADLFERSFIRGTRKVK
jgi:hypothetical protein